MSTTTATEYLTQTETLFVKLNDLKADLNRRIIGRAKEINLALIAVLARRHMLMLGLPGTGKTTLAEQLAVSLTSNGQGIGYFYVSCDEGTDPDEVWGPKSLKAYQEHDRWERALEGYAAKAEIVFLDEITRANSMLRNSMLGPMQSRVLVNGGKKVTLPLMAAFAASNFRIEDGALRDRFTIAALFERLPTADFRRLAEREMDGGMPDPLAFIDKADIEALQSMVDDVTVSPGIREDLDTLLQRLKQEGMDISERQWIMAVKPLKAAALLAGRQAVEIEDFYVLEAVLWTDEDDINVIRRCIGELNDLGVKAESKFSEMVGFYSSEMFKWRQETDTDLKDLILIRVLQQCKRTKQALQDMLTEAQRAYSDTSKIESALKDIEPYIVEAGRYLAGV